MNSSKKKIWALVKNEWCLCNIIEGSPLDDEMVVQVMVNDSIVKEHITIPTSMISKGNEEIATLFPVDETHLMDLNNLCLMNNLHNGPLIHMLRRRFKADKIYTYTGNILIAVNPYKKIAGLYDQPVLFYNKKLTSVEDIDSATHLPRADSVVKDDPPHIFDIAFNAYTNIKNILDVDMAENSPTSDDEICKGNQSIIISGESGSGKTEAGKLILNFLLQLNMHLYQANRNNEDIELDERTACYSSKEKSKLGSLFDTVDDNIADVPVAETTSVSTNTAFKALSSRQLEQRLAQSSIIFESFGNAKAMCNDNSSRFGKFIQLQYEHIPCKKSIHNPCGYYYSLSRAITETFLLEKSRLTTLTSEAERNYHVFYEFLSSIRFIPYSGVSLNSFGNQSIARQQSSSAQALLANLNLSLDDVSASESDEELLNFLELGLSANISDNLKKFNILHAKEVDDALGGFSDRRKSAQIAQMNEEELAEKNKIQEQHDMDQFLLLMNALDVLHFDVSMQRKMFDLLICILHLGNIEFLEENSVQKPVKMEKKKKKRRSSLSGVAEISAASTVTESGLHCSTLDISLLCQYKQLLGVPLDLFIQAVTMQRITIKARSSVSCRQLSHDESLNNVAALMKWLYNCLFHYIVHKVNSACAGKDYLNSVKSPNANNELAVEVDFTRCIGILDIFGFEILAHNSLEQLCINYTNELLQQQFNEQVFVLEQETYIEEGITNWNRISYEDNQNTIDLLVKKPYGLFTLLEEHAKLKNAHDTGLLTAFCMYHLPQTIQGQGKRDSRTVSESHEVFRKAKFGNTGFVVSHFAGDVTYSVTGFLEKNNLALQEDLLELMKTSSNGFIQEILAYDDANTKTQNQPEAENASRRASRGKQQGHATVSHLFRLQLDALMGTLSSTTPHYVKCIKPNILRKPAPEFDYSLVMKQLKYSGVLEVIRIRREGYPIRMSFQEFLVKYEIFSRRMPWRNDVMKLLKQHDTYGSRQFIPQTPLKPSEHHSVNDDYSFHVKEILSMPHVVRYLPKPGDDASLDSSLSLYQIGAYRIFMKESGLTLLAQAVTSFITDAVAHIQAKINGKFLLSKYIKLKEAVVKCQAAYRRHLYRKCFLGVRKIFIQCQMCIRRYLLTKRCRFRVQNKWLLFARRARVFLLIRRGVRVLRKLKAWEMLQHKNSTRISAQWRMCSSRKKYQIVFWLIRTLQAYGRMRLAVNRYNYTIAAIKSIQAVYRGRLGRCQAKERIRAVSKIQSSARKFIYRKHAEMLSSASKKCAALWRMYKQRRLYQASLSAIHIIGAFGRRMTFRSAFLKLRWKCIVLQKTIRMFLVKLRLISYRLVIVKLQGYWKCKRAMRLFASTRSKIIAVQSEVRQFLKRRAFLVALRMCVKIQKVIRGRNQRVEFKNKWRCIVSIQSHWRKQLDIRRYRHSVACVVLVQALIRKFIARASMKGTLRRCNLIQKLIRGCLARAFLRRQHQAARRTQSVIRRWLVLRLIRTWTAKAVQLQTWFRKCSAVKRFTHAIHCCIQLQSFFRGCCIRRKTRVYVASISKLQALWKRKQALLKFAVCKSSCVLIQSCIRMHLCVQHLMLSLQRVVRLQQQIRVFLLRCRYLHMAALCKGACVVIQKFVRRCFCQYSYRVKIGCIMTMQSVVRMSLAVRRYSRQVLFIIKFQSNLRRFLVELWCKRRKACAIRIQSCYRRYQCKHCYWCARVCIVRIQSNIRMLLAKCLAIRRTHLIVSIQKNSRRRLVLNHQRYLHKVASRIQALARMHHQVKAYRFTRYYITQLQAWWRCCHLQGLYKKKLQQIAFDRLNNAVIYVQALYRQLPIIRAYRRIKIRVLRLQRTWRKFMFQELYKRKVRSIHLILRVVRGFWGRSAARRRLWAISKLQHRCLHICARNAANRCKAQKMMAALYRMFVAQRNYQILRYHCCYIQDWYRAIKAAQAFEEQSAASIVIQKYVRRYQGQCYYYGCRRCIVLMQSFTRMSLKRLDFLFHKSCIIYIQSHMRKSICMKLFRPYISAATVIQTAVRRWRMKKWFDSIVAFRNNNAVIIQTFIRSRICKYLYRHVRRTIVRLQAFGRMRIAYGYYQDQLYCIIKMQSVFRMKSKLNEYSIRRNAILSMQGLYHIMQCRKYFQKCRGAFVVFQSLFRTRVAVRWYQKQLRRVILCQSCVRRYLGSLKQLRTSEAIDIIICEVRRYTMHKLYQECILDIYRVLRFGSEETIQLLIWKKCIVGKKYGTSKQAYFEKILDGLKSFRFNNDHYCSAVHCLVRNRNITGNVYEFICGLYCVNAKDNSSRVHVGVCDVLSVDDFFVIDMEGNTLMHHLMKASVHLNHSQLEPFSQTNPDLRGSASFRNHRHTIRKSVKNTVSVSNNDEGDANGDDRFFLNRLVDTFNAWMALYNKTRSHSNYVAKLKAKILNNSRCCIALATQRKRLFESCKLLSEGCWVYKKRAGGPWRLRYLIVRPKDTEISKDDGSIPGPASKPAGIFAATHQSRTESKFSLEPESEVKYILEYYKNCEGNNGTVDSQPGSVVSAPASPMSAVALSEQPPCRMPIPVDGCFLQMLSEGDMSARGLCRSLNGDASEGEPHGQFIVELTSEAIYSRKDLDENKYRNGYGAEGIDAEPSESIVLSFDDSIQFYEWVTSMLCMGAQLLTPREPSATSDVHAPENNCRSSFLRWIMQCNNNNDTPLHVLMKEQIKYASSLDSCPNDENCTTCARRSRRYIRSFMKSWPFVWQFASGFEKDGSQGGYQYVSDYAEYIRNRLGERFVDILGLESGIRASLGLSKVNSISQDSLSTLCYSGGSAENSFDGSSCDPVLSPVAMPDVPMSVDDLRGLENPGMGDKVGGCSRTLDPNTPTMTGAVYLNFIKKVVSKSIEGSWVERMKSPVSGIDNNPVEADGFYANKAAAELRMWSPQHDTILSTNSLNVDGAGKIPCSYNKLSNRYKLMSQRTELDGNEFRVMQLCLHSQDVFAPPLVYSSMFQSAVNVPDPVIIFPKFISVSILSWNSDSIQNEPPVPVEPVHGVQCSDFGDLGNTTAYFTTGNPLFDSSKLDSTSPIHAHSGGVTPPMAKLSKSYYPKAAIVDSVHWNNSIFIKIPINVMAATGNKIQLLFTLYTDCDSCEDFEDRGNVLCSQTHEVTLCLNNTPEATPIEVKFERKEEIEEYSSREYHSSTLHATLVCL